MAREDWVCMMRVRNEGRWIRRSLERTFEVCKTVVLLDDGSEDETVEEAACALGEIADHYDDTFFPSLDGQRELHVIHSPFRPAVRKKEGVNEIRDKNFLWYYTKARVAFKHVLCLDGDEVLTKEAIRQWPQVEQFVEHGVDMLTIPFVYLWDSEDQCRVDGIYGDLGDGQPRLRFPRIFSITRVDEQQVFDMHFSWEGTKGGFHCGSIPQVHFTTRHQEGGINGHFVAAPVAHYGYIDDSLRQRKFVFYNSIDPGNKAEGEYKHIIGQPDVHAPGPVELQPWEDV